MSNDDIPKLLQEDGSSDEETWEEINDEDDHKVRDLFGSDLTFNSYEEAIDHLKTACGFDLAAIKAKFEMDEYSYIRLVNFVRKLQIGDNKNKEVKISQLFTTQGEPLWLDDKNLKPVDHDDPWLVYDFDQLGISETRNTQEQTIESLKMQLAQALEDKEKMREAFTRVISKEPKPEKKVDSGKKVEGVASCSLEEDNGYFESYAHFGIHHSMLSDKVRTESYRDAILKNGPCFENKQVLDLGCGTGILSMFAAQAGARAVCAIDQSEIIYQAMEIGQTNGFKQINFVKGRLEDVKLPTDKVDIIVSEWMGYFLLFEGMLDSVIYARDNYLNPGGLLLPNRCTISLVGYGDQKRYGNFVTFFHDVYGFNMKCMLKDILREGHVEKCNGASVLTKPNTILDLDLMTCNVNYSAFSYDFNLEVVQTSLLTSFVGYFDTFFDLPKKVSFSTSPDSEPTHWHQVVFYLDEAVAVKAGDILTGKFICRRDRKDLRSLNIEIHTFGKVFKYDLN